MMAQAKRIYILMIKVNKLIFFFALGYFLTERDNMFSMFLLVKVCENSKMLWEHSLATRVPTAFLVLPNSQIFIPFLVVSNVHIRALSNLVNNANGDARNEFLQELLLSFVI